MPKKLLSRPRRDRGGAAPTARVRAAQVLASYAPYGRSRLLADAHWRSQYRANIILRTFAGGERDVASDWATLIEREQHSGRGQGLLLHATHFEHRFGSHQSPVRFVCGDQGRWVAKGHSAPKVAVTEMIVHSLGLAVGAPVPRFGLIEVSDALVRRSPTLRGAYSAGPWFASQWVAGVKDLVNDQKQGTCLHTTVRENRRRYAFLALLYGWAGTWSDIQFIYETDTPCLVHSVDHGHFFPDGPNWTVDSLRNSVVRAVPEHFIMSQVIPSTLEFRAAAQAMLRLDRSRVIAAAVSRPLDSWGVTMDERVACAQYLDRRGEELLQDLSAIYAK